MLIQLGEYKQGTDQEADNAIHKITAVNNFLKQNLDEKISFNDTLKALAMVVK